MKILHFAINLDRSPDRWAALQADARDADLPLIRVRAVDGKAVPQDERSGLDEVGFRRLHGKLPMDGEFGCYLSHLKALEAFLESDADAALVLEDDAVPAPDVVATLRALASRDDWDLVKLKNNRLPGLRAVRDVGDGYRLGRAPIGPTGSAAAYLVNRKGAARLLERLRPMRLPYDIAFERGWALGIRVRHLVPDLVSINPVTKTSVLKEGQPYSAMKLKPWQRLSAARFRAVDAGRRLRYALSDGR